MAFVLEDDNGVLLEFFFFSFLNERTNLCCMLDGWTDALLLHWLDGELGGARAPSKPNILFELGFKFGLVVFIANIMMLWMGLWYDGWIT